MTNPGTLAYQEGPMDGSESATLNPMRMVQELGIEAFEETGIALLQSPQERADYLAEEAARKDAAARHGRAPRFRRDPSAARPQNIESVDEELAIAATEGESLVTEKDFLDWARDRVEAVRDAGRRGTWKDRRDIRGRHGDREKPEFVGRYPGKCAVTAQVLAEYDASEIKPIVETV